MQSPRSSSMEKVFICHLFSPVFLHPSFDKCNVPQKANFSPELLDKDTSKRNQQSCIKTFSDNPNVTHSTPIKIKEFFIQSLHLKCTSSEKRGHNGIAIYRTSTQSLGFNVLIIWQSDARTQELPTEMFRSRLSNDFAF